MRDTFSPSEHSGIDIEMDDQGSPSMRNPSRQSLLQHAGAEPRRRALAGVARHTLGLILLLCVVFLWTMCNFLGSVCGTHYVCYIV